MRKNNIYIWIILLGMVFGAVLACGELDDTHKEFIKDGEQIYVGIPLEVYTNSGNERIRFNVVVNADPKISKGMVTWNGGENMHDFTVARTKEGLDTINFEMNLDEGRYTFIITLMDDYGNSSLEYEHTAVVYGPKYIASLFNRSISSIDAFSDYAVVNWSDAEAGVIETVFSYVNRSGEQKEIVVLSGESQTTLEDYTIGGDYSVVTKYMPNEMALESFSAAAETSTFPDDVLLDRSRWQHIVLPTDATMTCYGGKIANLWDGNTGSWYHSGCDADNGIPHHFTIDLGVTAQLTKFSLTPRQDCCQERNPKHFQVWGIQDTVNAMTTLASGDPAWEDDAIAKGWTLLADVETDASFEGSKDDYPADISDNTSVRFIRFRFVEAFTGGQETALSEFYFWASSIE